ncbi:aminotransferase class V-fold PLP-dependent enzyme [Agaribacter flavus]|uniref:cysteine desulfurase n=1 Tax=Agaribacter flavus TaxID=1902781 RepID=A0ABV7FND5_9ALTE
MTDFSAKKHFPYFSDNAKQVYLDSAATTQRLGAVIEVTRQAMAENNATVHRAAYKKASEATVAYENVRQNVASWINARQDEIVFTSGATESLNMIAAGIHAPMLNGTKILVCASEHHANLLPWQALASRLDLSIEVLPLEQDGVFSEATWERWSTLVTQDVCLIACAHVSNVLGNIYPVKALCQLAEQNQALTIIDGTQALAHLSVDVADIGCDFYVFSGHKMYGPTGTGVLFGRYSCLTGLLPSKLGGEMVSAVSYERFTTQNPPLKFEAGTPNVSGVIALGEALYFLREHMTQIVQHERTLCKLLMSRLKTIKHLRVLGNPLQQHGHSTNGNPQDTIGIVSFVLEQQDNHSIVQQLWQEGIALRYGHHCAMPLLQTLSVGACIRVSIGAYTDEQDILRFVETLQRILRQSEGDLASIENDSSYSEQTKCGKACGTQLDKPIIEQIVNIAEARDWSTKHRGLLLLSKILPILPEEERNANSELLGCESAVWLTNDSLVGWRAYSDSKVIRGILTLLITYSTHEALLAEAVGLPPNKHNHSEFLDQLGLSSYFSVGRRDGVSQIIKRLANLS